MANKYIQAYDTIAEYNAATKELPNVSFIAQTYEVKYKPLTTGETIGDVLMWDVANQKFVATLNAYWDATTYPIASYEPIAICVYPKHTSSDGYGRWMALKWVSNEYATGSATSVGLKWGTRAGTPTSDNLDSLNGRENTNSALSLADGTSANTQEAFAIFYAANIFYTNGTSAGDWYVPSYKEISFYADNYAAINTMISNIKTASSAIVDTVTNWQASSTRASGAGSASTFRGMNQDGALNYLLSRNKDYPCRAFLML